MTNKNKPTGATGIVTRDIKAEEKNAEDHLQRITSAIGDLSSAVRSGNKKAAKKAIAIAKESMRETRKSMKRKRTLEASLEKAKAKSGDLERCKSDGKGLN